MSPTRGHLSARQEDPPVKLVFYDVAVGHLAAHPRDVFVLITGDQVGMVCNTLGGVRRYRYHGRYHARSLARHRPRQGHTNQHSDQRRR